MVKKWIKRVALILLLGPILLFILLMILLYVPPVQNLIRKEAVAYASKATGMQIDVRRIDLRFPFKLLVRGVEVIQAADTIFTLESLSASVQVMPLFKGKAELDNLTLLGATVNTAGLIEGMRVSGTLGRFSLESHGIDLPREVAVINNAELSNTRIQLCLNDTTGSPEERAEGAVNWKVSLLNLTLDNVSFGLQMPADSLVLRTYLKEAAVTNASVDLGEQHYGLEKLLISNAKVKYDAGSSPPGAGFDPSHLFLRNIRIELDSVASRGREMNAVVRGITCEDRSGLSLTSFTGSFRMDSEGVRIPGLRLTTPHSELNFAAQAAWDMLSLRDDLVTAQLDGHIGKQDVLLFAGGLPEAFINEYPFRPLVLRLTAKGNMSKFELSRFSADLPGAFSLTGGGEIEYALDSVRRTGVADIHLRTDDLGFLSHLAGVPHDGSVVIPGNMTLAGKASVRGPQYTTTLLAREGAGSVHLDAAFNSLTEEYTATLNIDSLDVNHFLPKDSLYTVTVSASLKGKGLDFTSPRTSVSVEADVGRLRYAAYRVSGVHLTGGVKNAVASARLTSDNPLLAAEAEGSYALDKPYTEARATVRVSRLNLHELGLIPDTLKKPVAFDLDAVAGKDTVGVSLSSGDLKLLLRSRGSLEKLLEESAGFAGVLSRQIAAKRLDHAEMRRALPSAALTLTSGKENPLNHYLALQQVSYESLNAGFVATPRLGINGRAAIHSLKVDTLQLDTVYFSTSQDTARMVLHGGVINGPGNPQFVFDASLTGEIRNQDAGLTLRLNNAKGETGILLGVNVRPEREGVEFHLTPERPVIAYREFGFNGHNRVFVRNNLRVLADVEMLDKEGMGVRVRSLEEADTTYLQNLDIEVRRIELAELSGVLPYLPEISGLFSLEANYRQSVDNMLVSAEGTINDLVYEGNRVGNLGVGVAWLPDNAGTHYLNAYLTSEGNQILSADGAYRPAEDAVSVSSVLDHFPLHIANAFIPDRLVELSGDLDGDLKLTGSSSGTRLDGQLLLDEALVTSLRYGANFRFDKRPVRIEDSRAVFDQFAIYTTTDNPFTIDGYVDMANLSNPMVNLSLQARNYLLLDAPRHDASILYGRVFLDLNSTVRGAVDQLVMRGNVKLLANTDVTYVMVDSPLSVQDRLSDLVEFTSFSDTLLVVEEEKQLAPLGGLDMLMAMSIDQQARVKVDLSPDRSSHVELQGGGDLSFQYTPQGDMSLAGRYTLTGGTVKYSLPVIPLKEFKVITGSYVEWTGNPADPLLNLKATERVRASVANEDNSGTHTTNFDVSIEVKNRLDNLGLIFNLEAPEDPRVQDQLNAMDAEERNKQAITLMATGLYLAGGGGVGNLDMGAALNSVLQNQIANIAGSALQSVNISFGMENYDDGEGRHTDYSFSYAQRFFNDRVQVVIGGTISTGDNAEQASSFIDNISLEYRLDTSGARYVRLFHNKNYQNILEGEVIETGAGLVLRKKVNRLGELFLFKKKKE